jgi:ribosomal protein S5
MADAVQAATRSQHKGKRNVFNIQTHTQHTISSIIRSRYDTHLVHVEHVPATVMRGIKKDERT